VAADGEADFVQSRRDVLRGGHWFKLEGRCR